MATFLQEYREQYSRLMALHLVFFVLSVLNGRSSAGADVESIKLVRPLSAMSRQLRSQRRGPLQAESRNSTMSA